MPAEAIWGFLTTDDTDLTGRVLLASFSCFHGFLIFTAEVAEDAEKGIE